LKIPEFNKIIIYVGNITINRGLEELIQSIVYLNHCVVVIMGRASNFAYSQKLKQLARDVAVENKVYYFGPVPFEDVTKYAASADVGVAPIKNACLSYYYCLPNKLFEYIAGGLPTVVSNFPELKRVIKEYNLGRTFNPDDPKDIAEAINYVLSDKDKYEEMKRNALQAAKVFNWENESKKLLEIYKKLGDELSITSN
jgi:glycosyltransferase involved in cell wall biosynthesis